MKIGGLESDTILFKKKESDTGASNLAGQWNFQYKDQYTRLGPCNYGPIISMRRLE